MNIALYINEWVDMGKYYMNINVTEEYKRKLQECFGKFKGP